MFTIRRGKFEYYAEDGGFVTLAEYSAIKWFPHYVTASQAMMKLCERGPIETIDAHTVLEELLKGILGLAPELVRFASGRTDEELKDVSEIRELAVLRGGILEHKDTIHSLQHALEASKQRERMLLTEASKLVEVTTEYDRVVKEIGS